MDGHAQRNPGPGQAKRPGTPETNALGGQMKSLFVEEKVARTLRLLTTYLVSPALKNFPYKKEICLFTSSDYHRDILCEQEVLVVMVAVVVIVVVVLVVVVVIVAVAVLVVVVMVVVVMW